MYLMKATKLLVLASLLIFSLTISCSDDSSNRVISPEPSGDPELQVDKIAVSVVPGGVELVTVTALDNDGVVETCTVLSSDESVVTVTQNNNVFMVTGQNYGHATVTVTSASGLTRGIPIQIYNPVILDCGELILTYTNTYVYRWHDAGSGGDYNGSYWHPVPPEGYYAMGSLGRPNWSNPNGTKPMIVVKAKDPNSALPPIKHPTDYTWVYNDAGTGSNNDGSFWMPVAPVGYKALGIVANSGWGKPALTEVVCVREDLTTLGKGGGYIWHDVGTGGTYDVASWEISIPTSGAHESAYLAPGTFIAWNYWIPPTAHDAMNVLKVNLPMLVEAPQQMITPQLTSYEEPGPETAPIMGKAMLVPFSIISDVYYASNPNLQVANSPFYRLERYTYYKLIYFYNNNTSETQENSVLIRSGVQTTESESFWNETGVSVTAEGGINIGVFSGSVSTTVSTSFGYETMTSISVLQEKEVTSTVYTAPGKAAALWQQFNRFILKRHNGNKLEIVSSWEFGIDSYLVSDYPQTE
jgi:hypothetical protein